MLFFLWHFFNYYMSWFFSTLPILARIVHSILCAIYIENIGLANEATGLRNTDDHRSESLIEATWGRMREQMDARW